METIKGKFYQGCENLESIDFASGSPFEWFENSIVNKKESILIVGSENGIIPENVKNIGDYAFMDCSFYEIVIPKTIQSIGKSAFLDCKNLSTINIEDSKDILEVGNKAFPKNIKQAYVGRNLKYTDSDRATFNSYSPFAESKIQTITLGTYVTKIPCSFFMKCYNLEKCNILGCIEFLGAYAFNRCENLQEFPFTDSNCTITKISDGVFEFCSGLKKIILPKSITTLAGTAFNQCRKLDYVYFSPTFESIERSSALDYCTIDTLIIDDSENSFYLNGGDEGGTSVKNLYLGRKTGLDSNLALKLKNLVFGNLLGTATFTGKNSNLETIDFGVNIKEITKGTFLECKKISKIISRNPVPPSNAIFDSSVYVNSEVKVPKGSLAAYQADTYWCNFWNISEMDFSGIDDVIDEEQTLVDVYNLQGVLMRKGVQRSEATQGLPQGIYVIGGKKVIVK